MRCIIPTFIGVCCFAGATGCLGAESTSAGPPSATSVTSNDEENPVVATAADLIANPEKFAGKYVRVSGYWLTAFEYSGLHSTAKFTGMSPIWVDYWSIPGMPRQVKDPQAIHAALIAAYKEAGINENLPHGTVRVTLEGYFDHKTTMDVTKKSYPFPSGYGHLGQYSSLLTVERVVEAKALPVDPNSFPK